MDNGITSYVENGLTIAVYPPNVRAQMTPPKNFSVVSNGARERKAYLAKIEKTLPKGKTKCR